MLEWPSHFVRRMLPNLLRFAHANHFKESLQTLSFLVQLITAAEGNPLASEKNS